MSNCFWIVRVGLLRLLNFIEIATITNLKVNDHLILVFGSSTVLIYESRVFSLAYRCLTSISLGCHPTVLTSIKLRYCPVLCCFTLCLVENNWSLEICSQSQRSWFLFWPIQVFSNKSIYVYVYDRIWYNPV